VRPSGKFERACHRVGSAQARHGLGGAYARPGRSSLMDKQTVYDEPSDVSAEEGAVEVEGPDHVEVAMTPEAAEETSERLTTQAVKARGQRRLSRLTHRAQ
jgi:hypothetical protein